MFLYELIEILRGLFDKYGDGVIKHGFGQPNSYRGYYYDVAFEPKENVKLSEMLRYAESALGEEFEGWKGGYYKMEEDSDVWIAEWGKTEGATYIGETLIKYWEDDLKEVKE